MFRVPTSSVDRNGILLKLEGDVSALFFRNNETHNILTTNGVIRVNVSSVFLWIGWTGIEFFKEGLRKSASSCLNPTPESS